MGEWLAVQRRNGQLSDILFLASTIGLTIFQRFWQAASAFLHANSLCLHPDFASYRLSVCIMLPFALVVDLHYMTPFISC